MPRILSLNARLAAYGEAPADVPVVLVTIDHEELDAPIRLSSDPTVRLSDEPLRYGTISNGEEYDFVLLSVSLPDEEEDTPPAASLVIENVAADMVALVRSVATPLTVDLALVLASAPDALEEHYRWFRSTKISYDAATVSIDLIREPLSTEPWPAQRMTKSRFPGLFR